MGNNDRMPQVENALAGIVITAQTFNPSIFSETWLVQNGIIPSDAFQGLRLCSPDVAQFQTAHVQLMVIPPKLQITFSLRGNDLDVELPRKMAKLIVQLLPHTPYQSLGLNFDFFIIQSNGEDFLKYNRALFGDGTNAILEEFVAPDAKFGRYFSKDHGQARLKLDVKPVQAGPDKKDLLQFSFNFHHEVRQAPPQERADMLTGMLQTWDALRLYAERLLVLGTHEA